jgi:hypothetical protein
MVLAWVTLMLWATSKPSSISSSECLLQKWHTVHQLHCKALSPQSEPISSSTTCRTVTG